MSYSMYAQKDTENQKRSRLFLLCLILSLLVVHVPVFYFIFGHDFGSAGSKMAQSSAKKQEKVVMINPVSYTHLTLPTSPKV